MAVSIPRQTGALDGFFQRPARQHADQVTAEFGRAAHVGDGAGRVLGDLAGCDDGVRANRLSSQSRAASGTDSGVGATAARAMRAATKRVRPVIQLHRCADADHRNVHFVARDEAQIGGAESGRGGGRWRVTRNSPGCSTVRPGAAELLDGHVALAVRPATVQVAMDDQRRDRVRRRRGVAQVAAQAGAALDLHAADQAAASTSPG